LDNLPELLSDRLSDSELCIFLFHGVIPRNTKIVRNYTGKHMNLDCFHKCIRRLCSAGHPITIEQAYEFLREGLPFPKRSFVISFDDGFENNYSVAMPVLVDYKIKPVIYLTTSFVDSGERSWIDKIEAAFESSKQFSLKFEWLPASTLVCSTEEKISILKRVRQFVKSNPQVDPLSLAAELIEQMQLDTEPDYDDFLDKKLTWKQICHLNEAGLATIGGHSHSHRILAFLSEEELALEIDTSLDLLSTRCGVRPDHYSYPEGLLHCFNGTVIEYLKYRGVKCCPTAIDGTNCVGSDPFLLKRIMVA
jgi:peptidoglycan/xylan/chitin deacetylase (PgdA/CDA1 family)